MIWYVIYIAWNIFNGALADYSVIVDTVNFTAVFDYRVTQITEAKVYCAQVYKADLAWIENYAELAKLSRALVEKRNLYGTSSKAGHLLIDGRTQTPLFSSVALSSIVYGGNITDKDSNCVAFESWSHSAGGLQYFEADSYKTTAHPCEATYVRSFLCRKKMTHNEKDDPENEDDTNTVVPDDPNVVVPDDPNVVVPDDPNVVVPDDPNVVVPDDPNVVVPDAGKQCTQWQEEVWVLAVTAVAGVVFGSILTGILICSGLRCKRMRKTKTSEKTTTQSNQQYEVPNSANNGDNANYTSLNPTAYYNLADPPQTYLTVN